MIYVLAYPEFEPSVEQRINRFRSAHEPQRAKMVPPHVTLVFGLKRADPRDILTQCSSVSGYTSKLSVEFAGSKIVYDPFDKTHKLFLLCGKGKGTLTELHQKLYAGPHRAEFKSDIPYEPHMTVATHRDRSIVEQLDVADLGALPFTGTIRALELVELRDGTVNTIETVPFFE